MRINSNSEPADLTGLQTKTATRQTSVQEAAQDNDNVSLNSIDDLKKSLDQTPAVRADKVAQAKALLAGGSYPSDSTLSKVAGLLANNLSGQSHYTSGAD